MRCSALLVLLIGAAGCATLDSDCRCACPSTRAAGTRSAIWHTDDGLVGAVDTFFLGHRVNPGLLLAPQP